MPEPPPPGGTVPRPILRDAVKGTPAGSNAGSFTPAAVFRDMLTQLVDEYERMQAVLIRLEDEDILPTRSTPPSVPCLIIEASEPTEGSDAPQQPRPSEHVDGQAEELVGRKPSSAIFRVSSTDVNFRRHPALFLARSRRFQRFIGFVITLNMILLGITSNIEMSIVTEGDHGTTLNSVHAIETVFFAIYVIELAIRLVAFGKRFFTSRRERVSNIFDAVLVLQGAFEQVFVYASVTNVVLSGRLRAVRLVKMVKMMRALRLMRSMRELRMIVSAFTGSVRSMVWSLVLLGYVVYMFSLIFINGIVDYINATGDAIGRDEYDVILLYWGSVPTAMQTLFKSCTGGMDWETAAEALALAGPVYRFCFMMFISFFIFVIVNIVNALFVENTMLKASKDFQSAIHAELEKKQEYVRSLRVLFGEIDEDADGVVSFDEFSTKIEDPRLEAFFAALDIEVLDATHFFKLISDGGTRPVTLDLFVTSCIRMRGSALAVDLHELMCMQSLAQKEMDCFISRSDRDFKSLRTLLETSLTEHFHALETRLRLASLKGNGP